MAHSADLHFPYNIDREGDVKTLGSWAMYDTRHSVAGGIQKLVKKQYDFFFRSGERSGHKRSSK